MSYRSFHLSLGVNDIEKSIIFFEGLLKGTVTHRDKSGYVNIELFGSQITLKENENIKPDLPDFHFGLNLDLDEFESLSQSIMKEGKGVVEMGPKVIDAGTSMERKKMYLKSPTGYLVELKGYKKIRRAL